MLKCRRFCGGSATGRAEITKKIGGAIVYRAAGRTLLIKKRTAPYSCFCVPHPQKNVFDRVHLVQPSVGRGGRRADG